MERGEARERELTVAIASVRNAPLSAATLMFGGTPSVVGQLAPSPRDASVRVCTSIERKPASSKK